MKKSIRQAALLLAALTLCACQKENGDRLLLEAEGMHGNAKVAVNGAVSHWASGDQVRINGQTFTVDINESGQASVSLGGLTLSAPFCGVYPASIYSSNGDNSYTLNLPDTYTYATCQDGASAIRQNLPSPMLAYTANNNGDRLFFRHVTGAITVEITNNFGFNVYVTNVTVASDRYQLCGSRTVNITTFSGENGITPVESENNRQVQMTFSTSPLDNSHLDIALGATGRVQIPVLPVGNGNHFTISVTVQDANNPDKNYTFTKTQSTGGSLLRAQLGYAPAKFGGVFSVASNKVVRFAPGNLQYQASTGTWRFALNQYDAIGSGNNNISNNYDGWIDLFGWGTSGWNNDGAFNSRHYQPYASANGSGDDALYGPPGEYDLTGSYADADWGIENSISNGGGATQLWRTLTAAEWQYLFDSRTDASKKRGFGFVNSIDGLILLPDEFIDPMLNGGNEAFKGQNSDIGYYANNYTATDWKVMEAAGAIFLPVTCKRNGTTIDASTSGFYWSSSHESNNKAICLDCNLYGYALDGSYRYIGCAVRLVRNDQPTH